MIFLRIPRYYYNELCEKYKNSQSKIVYLKTPNEMKFKLYEDICGLHIKINDSESYLVATDNINEYFQHYQHTELADSN